MAVQRLDTPPSRARTRGFYFARLLQPFHQLMWTILLLERVQSTAPQAITDYAFAH